MWQIKYSKAVVLRQSIKSAATLHTGESALESKWMYPEWKRHTGAHDAYNVGDKCSYIGKHWICNINGNVHAPDVYGWHEA